MKISIFYLKTTTSTNDVALKKIREGKDRGIIISQTQKKVEEDMEINGFH